MQSPDCRLPGPTPGAIRAGPPGFPRLVQSKLIDQAEHLHLPPPLPPLRLLQLCPLLRPLALALLPAQDTAVRLPCACVQSGPQGRQRQTCQATGGQAPVQRHYTNDSCHENQRRAIVLPGRAGHMRSLPGGLRGGSLLLGALRVAHHRQQRPVAARHRLRQPLPLRRAHHLRALQWQIQLTTLFAPPARGPAPCLCEDAFV